jgi:hypothetical protein
MVNNVFYSFIMGIREQGNIKKSNDKMYFCHSLLIQCFYYVGRALALRICFGRRNKEII